MQLACCCFVPEILKIHLKIRACLAGAQLHVSVFHGGTVIGPRPPWRPVSNVVQPVPDPVVHGVVHGGGVIKQKLIQNEKIDS